MKPTLSNRWSLDASEPSQSRQHLLDLAPPQARLADSRGFSPATSAAATAPIPQVAAVLSKPVTPSSKGSEPVLAIESTKSKSGSQDAPPPPPPTTPEPLSRGIEGWTQARVDQLISAGKIKAEWLPDMRAVAPSHLQIQNEHKREMLRFSNSIANTGANNLQVRRGRQLVHPLSPADQQLFDYAKTLGLDPSQVAVTAQELLNDNGQLAAVVGDAALSEYHPDHRHFHIGETAEFGIQKLQADGKTWDTLTGLEVVKTTFCLIDICKIKQVSATDPDLYEVVKSPANQTSYNDCFADVQGIQAGWMDRYSHSLPGQEVDVTGLQAGVYRVVSRVNPSNWFMESNFENNLAWTSFTLNRDSNGNPLIHEIDGGVGGIWFQQQPNGMG